MCMCLCGCWLYACRIYKSQKTGVNSLGAELQLGVEHLMLVLGTELQFSGRTSSSLNCQAISQISY